MERIVDAVLRDERAGKLLRLIYERTKAAPREGTPIIKLPRKLLDPELFHLLLVAKLAKVHCRDYSTEGGKLVLQSGWNEYQHEGYARLTPAEALQTIIDGTDGMKTPQLIYLTNEGTAIALAAGSTTGVRAKSASQRGAKQETGNANPIPARKRTIPLTLKRAAKLIGKTGNPKDAAEWLAASIGDGSYQAVKISRQNWIFNIDAFNESVHSLITPQVAVTGGKRR